MLNLLLAAVWVGAGVVMLVRRDHYFWDFRVYYAAARELLEGRNPYEMPYRVYVGYGWAALPYVYPPLATLFFVPFARLNVDLAAGVWMVLKLLALFNLVAIWRRSFVPAGLDWRVGTLLLFGFNAALYTDFATGNAAVLEAWSLFAACEALLARRLWKFATLVVAVSLFKMVPLIFLLMLPIMRGSRGWRPLVYSVLFFAVYWALNVAVFAHWLPDYMAVLATRTEDRANNPTVFTMLRDLGARAGFPGWPVLYGAAAVGIVAATAKAVRPMLRVTPYRAILLLWSCLPLLSPRFMIYSYVELIPMAWVALSEGTATEQGILLIFIGYITPTSYLFIQRPAWGQWLARVIDIGPATYGYFSTIGALLIWWMLLKDPVRERPASGQVDFSRD